MCFPTCQLPMETSPKITKVWGSSWTTLWLFPKAHLSFEVSTSDSESSISTMAKRTAHDTKIVAFFFFFGGRSLNHSTPRSRGTTPQRMSRRFRFCLFFRFFARFFLWSEKEYSEFDFWFSILSFLPLKILETTFYKVILLLEEIRSSAVEVGSLSHYLQGFIHRWWLALGFLEHLQGQWWFLESWEARFPNLSLSLDGCCKQQQCFPIPVVATQTLFLFPPRKLGGRNSPILTI